MKLFFKAIALAAKDPNFKGNPRDELNRLIDVAEANGLTVWHDNFCFKSTFWDWGNRKTGNINWGGYGSSYKPANESYFKFQYPGDTVDANGSKLITRKGAKPLDAVKALVLPEADADGAMQALLAKAGANPVYVADKGLKADAIVDLLTKKKCNFLLTADDLPKGLIEALEKAAESKNYFFTLPVGRLRPLLVKAPKASVKRGPKAPPAFADKDDAKAFSKLKALLGSQKFEEIDQAITLLPGLPGVCDKLLEGISLAKGITAWTNDAKVWTSSENYNRPSGWGECDGKLPSELTSLGETFRLGEVPKNDLFNTSEAKRYALFSVINAAPEECVPAKSIREGLVALHWADDRLPPLSNFKALRHLYLFNSKGDGFTGSLVSLIHKWGSGSNQQDPMDLDWIHALKSLRRLDLYFNTYSRTKSDAFLKKASFPMLEELHFERYGDNSPPIPPTVKHLGISNLWITHERLPEFLSIPRIRADEVRIAKNESDDYATDEKAKFQQVQVIPIKDRGEVLAPKELSALKKLLRDDAPETVMQGIKILHTASPATIDALLEKSTVDWGYNSEGVLGGNSGARLSGPFFDSLKRTDLGEAVRVNLLSLATPGCKAADEIRSRVGSISVSCPVPIDFSGFSGLRALSLTLDPSKPTDNWITGIDHLGDLTELNLNLSCRQYDAVVKNPAPLGFVTPPGVTEMRIEFQCRVSGPSRDFIAVSPNLRKLTVESFGSLEGIATLGRIAPSKLEELKLGSSYSDEDLPPEDLSALAPFVNLRSITGSRSNLNSLKGVVALKELRVLELESESLGDISELSRMTGLESLKLGDSSASPFAIAPLANLPALKSMDLGGHKVSDPASLLKFRHGTSISLKNLDSRGG